MTDTKKEKKEIEPVISNNDGKKEDISTSKEIIKPKRKRGRPKKIRTPEEQQREKEKKPKKKRGRKPRKKTKEELENIPVKRKRGRKPRDRFYTMSNKQKKELLDTNLHQDSLIVYLPINIDKIDLYNKNNKDINLNDTFIENSILEYKPTLNIPKPYDPSVNNQDFNSHSELANTQTINTEKSLCSNKKN